MAIDLSKIPVRELPVKKDVKVTICGVAQTCDIRPVMGHGALEEWALGIGENPSDPAVIVRKVELNLIHGAGLSEEDAKEFINRDWQSALNLSAEIIAFTSEYTSELAKEKEKAEKNSGTADTPAMPS